MLLLRQRLSLKGHIFEASQTQRPSTENSTWIENQEPQRGQGCLRPHLMSSRGIIYHTSTITEWMVHSSKHCIWNWRCRQKFIMLRPEEEGEAVCLQKFTTPAQWCQLLYVTSRLSWTVSHLNQMAHLFLNKLTDCLMKILRRTLTV